MPDKHEVGGSSPLGPTNEPKVRKWRTAKPNKSAICIQQSAFNYGGVAQLGEHLPCKQGVMGSNPIISTMRYGIGQKRTLKLESKDSNRGGSE